MQELATICKGCWQQMHVPVPLRGVMSLPFRLFGIRPSAMNPNTCTICELMFTRVMKARKIAVETSVLFADLRGFTAMSQSQSADAVSGVLDAFYDTCAEAIWEHDGLLNKTIGDAVMAVFNFPIKSQDHARRAVLAARTIQHRWGSRGAALVRDLGISSAAFGVGVGIDSGEVSFGEFGRAHRDLTAIGTVVNTAARAQAAAAAGEILVTKSVRDRAQPEFGGREARDYQLKGYDAPVALYSA